MNLRSGVGFKYPKVLTAILLIFTICIPPVIFPDRIFARTPFSEPVSEGPVGETYYTIMNKASGRVIDVYDGSLLDGIGMIQWSENSGNNQLWQFIDAGAGFYKIKNKHSGKLLDISPGSKASGTPVVQWYDHGGPSLLWEKIDAGSGYCKLKNKASGKLMRVADNPGEDGARIVQWDDDGDPRELWQLNKKSI